MSSEVSSSQTIIAALRNPGLPLQFVEAFWHSDWQGGLLEPVILERPGLSAEIIRVAVLSPRPAVREAAAKHQRLTQHQVVMLSQDSAHEVRRALSLNPLLLLF